MRTPPSGSAFNPTLKFLLLLRSDRARACRQGSGRIPRHHHRAGGRYFLRSRARPRDDIRIPVLIEIDPALMRPETAREMTKPDSDFLKDAVGKGLRAALKTGSLITGAFMWTSIIMRTPCRGAGKIR